MWLLRLCVLVAERKTELWSLRVHGGELASEEQHLISGFHTSSCDFVAGRSEETTSGRLPGPGYTYESTIGTEWGGCNGSLDESSLGKIEIPRH